MRGACVGLALVGGLLGFAEARATSPFLTVGLPWVFGVETDEPPLYGPARPEFAAPRVVDRVPLIDLDLSGEETQEPPLDNDMLARETLAAWRDLWRQGQYDRAVVVAEKAVALAPRNLDALHARAVSYIVAPRRGN